MPLLQSLRTWFGGSRAARLEAAIRLHEGGDLAGAERRYRALLGADPRDADATHLLGLIAHQRGEHALAVAEIGAAIALKADKPVYHFNLGNALLALERPEAAMHAFRAAIELDPAHVAASLNLGTCLESGNRWSEAAEVYSVLLGAHADLAAVHNRLANCYNQLGRMAEARSHYLEVCRIDPAFVHAWTSALACLNYDPACPAERAAAEHRRWAGEVAARHYPEGARHDNERDPARRLRVGYVSPDLRRHPVSAIFAPILAAHDRNRVEVTCYYNFAGEDAVTLHLKALAARWRPVAGMDDDALCRQIRDDRIDILVDLAGHTSHSRLLAFARKPAPVQVSWLGYFNTTGLATMDYFLSDPWSSPAGQERYYVERLLRLPHTRFCYQPPEYMPAVGPLPAATTGHVTFGCLNTLSKVNDAVLALWARVLQAVPQAKLLLQAAAFDDAPNRARFAALCARHGIAPARLELRGFVPIDQAPASYAAIDIALDPFPFCGGMTSLEALWLGVPVITLPGETIASRQSASLLMNLGLAELIAEDAGQYVEKAARLAHDLPRLAGLRAGLRQRFAASPLQDYAGFARALEAAYRDMWLHWMQRV